MDREDPKRLAFCDAAKRSLTIGGLGSVDEKAASALSDFVLVDMFANFCTGKEDLKSSRLRSANSNEFIAEIGREGV